MPVDSGAQKNHALQGASKSTVSTGEKKENIGFQDVMDTLLQGNACKEGNQQQVKAGQHVDENYCDSKSEDSESQKDTDQMLGSSGNDTKCIAGWVPPQLIASNQVNPKRDAASLQTGISDVSGSNTQSTQSIWSFASIDAANGTASAAVNKQKAGAVNAPLLTSSMQSTDSIKPASDNQTESQTVKGDNNGKSSKSISSSLESGWCKIDQILVNAVSSNAANGKKDDNMPGQLWDSGGAVTDPSDKKDAEALKSVDGMADKTTYMPIDKPSDGIQVSQSGVDKHTYHINNAQSAVDKTGFDLSNQIVRAAKLQVSNGGGDLYLRLDPPQLGMLHMNVSSHEGSLTAHIYASTESAKQMLEADVKSLRDILHNAGITVDAINISMDDKQSGDWNLQSNSQNRWGETSGRGGNRHSGLVTSSMDGQNISLNDNSPVLLAGLFDFFA